MLPFTFRGPSWKDDADELAYCSLPASWPAAWTVTPDGGPSYACVIVWRVRLAFPASDTAVESFDWPTPPGCGASSGVAAGPPAVRVFAAFSVPEPSPICWSSPFRFAAAPSAVDALSCRIDPESPLARFVFSGSDLHGGRAADHGRWHVAGELAGGLHRDAVVVAGATARPRIAARLLDRLRRVVRVDRGADCRRGVRLGHVAVVTGAQNANAGVRVVLVDLGRDGRGAGALCARRLLAGRLAR